MRWTGASGIPDGVSERDPKPRLPGKVDIRALIQAFQCALQSFAVFIHQRKLEPKCGSRDDDIEPDGVMFGRGKCPIYGRKRVIDGAAIDLKPLVGRHRLPISLRLAGKVLVICRVTKRDRRFLSAELVGLSRKGLKEKEKSFTVAA